jgi:hypothetical protein
LPDGTSEIFLQEGVDRVLCATADLPVGQISLIRFNNLGWARTAVCASQPPSPAVDEHRRAISVKTD